MPSLAGAVTPSSSSSKKAGKQRKGGLSMFLAGEDYSQKALCLAVCLIRHVLHQCCTPLHTAKSDRPSMLCDAMRLHLHLRELLHVVTWGIHTPEFLLHLLSPP